MKMRTVGDVYFQLMRCQLTWTHLEERPLNEFVIVVMTI